VKPSLTLDGQKLLAEGAAFERSSSAKPASASSPSTPPHTRKFAVKRTEPQPQPLDLDAQFRAAYEASRRVSGTASEMDAAEDEAIALPAEISHDIQQGSLACCETFCICLLTLTDREAA
jgi:hypothetical protein